MKIWVEIGENYYEMEAEGDQEEFFEPNIVEVHYDGDEARKDWVTFYTFRREWEAAHPKKSCIQALHSLYLDALVDDYDSRAE